GSDAPSPGILFGFLIGLREGVAEPRESGKSAVGFALSLGAAGAVGMWESRSDFQGRWKGWKTCIWFSRLSTDRHFHSLARLRCGRIAIGFEMLAGLVLGTESTWRFFPW